jgi:hypothetical protein
LESFTLFPGNVEKYDKSQAKGDNKIQRMRFSWWIMQATGTHSEYEAFIVFPRQQWFCEPSLMLRYSYIISLCFVLSSLVHPSFLLIYFVFIQGGSKMTGTNCDLFTHK